MVCFATHYFCISSFVVIWESSRHAHSSSHICAWPKKGVALFWRKIILIVIDFSNLLLILTVIFQFWIWYNKKDGYRQRNVRQFLHILASPEYALGTIAVNVTWMERGFNAGQTHCSIYFQPFTSDSEILVGNCNFFLPPCICKLKQPLMLLNLNQISKRKRKSAFHQLPAACNSLSPLLQQISRTSSFKPFI